MILLTIGTHEPFDRLVMAMDEIAGKIQTRVIAQVVSTNYRIENMESLGFVPPSQLEGLFREAEFIVCHAGMGSILTAFELGKPVIAFPRMASLHETRNEHQLATVKKLQTFGYLYVAYDKEQLEAIVLMGINGDLKPLHTIGKFASSNLINAVKQFMES